MATRKRRGRGVRRVFEFLMERWSAGVCYVIRA